MLSSYQRSGSSGVLPKPAKLEELTALLQSKLSFFVGQGVCVVDNEGFIKTPDGTFCFRSDARTRTLGSFVALVVISGPA